MRCGSQTRPIRRGGNRGCSNRARDVGQQKAAEKSVYRWQDCAFLAALRQILQIPANLGIRQFRCVVVV
ncbi:MAG TPA: hypothetical protein DC058_14965 [Planctomycetaceae bacterium]|nr:hypothetical protein [Planctomycetaceae bacterium]